MIESNEIDEKIKFIKVIINGFCTSCVELKSI
jgi:hypothetical protein